jgi:hypothetical protein
MIESEAFQQSLGMTLRSDPMAVDSAEQLWRELMVTAEFSGPRASGHELAESINDNPFSDQFAMSLGLTLGRILNGPDDLETRRVLSDAGDLIVDLRPALVAGLLRAEPETRRRTFFFERVVERLPLAAAYRLVNSLASMVNRPLSSQLKTQLRSQSRRLELMPPDLRPEAEETLRATLLALVATLNGSDTLPGEGTPRARPAGRAIPEAERLIQLAIEVDAPGDAVWIALSEMVATESVRAVVELVKQAPLGPEVTAAIMKRIATAEELARLVEHEPIDEEAIDAFLHGLGVAAARVLLEALVESRSRAVRKVLLERLAGFGPQIQPLVEGRLRDNRWFVQRNMLALLRACSCRPDPSLATRFLQNSDERVRREAVLWCLQSQETRDRAIVEGLKDASSDVLRPVLQAARAGLPQSAVPVLAKRVLESDFPPGFRVLALSLLGRSGNALALEALLHFASTGRTLLGKPRLASKSPEMLAAVTALARTWRADRRAGGILEQAVRSRDAQVVAAAKTGSLEIS